MIPLSKSLSLDLYFMFSSKLLFYLMGKMHKTCFSTYWSRIYWISLLNTSIVIIITQTQLGQILKASSVAVSRPVTFIVLKVIKDTPV